MFTIGLIDKISEPISKIQNSLDSIDNKARSAFSAIAIGAAGVVGAGLALQAGLQPAIEMNRAMGEVGSLGVHGDALDTLKSKALAFSTKYGSSATEFVSASYDIQSAISGLNGTELASFTEASAVLAKATKADTATITDYMGTMYGVFKKQSAAMGNDNWVKVVAGQTASAVQMFKTTGAEMSSAFTSLGADATSVGVAMNEQMAILGTLQATMSGSEAGTKYRAFLAGIDKSQRSLGMSFTDTSGNILPMIDILDKLKDKYGDTLNVTESAELSKAFGTQEAVGMIKLLMSDTDRLAVSINSLGNVDGLEKAAEMAEKMTDPWQRVGQGINNVRIAIGSALLPALELLTASLADGAAKLLFLVQEFPNITKWVGIAATSILGVSAALAALNMMMGIATLVTTGYAIASKAAGTALAFVTSPVTLTIAAIGMLVAAVVSLVYYWDEIKASLTDTGWGSVVVFALESIAGLFKKLWALAGAISRVILTALKPVLFILKIISFVVGSVLTVSFKVLQGVIVGVFTVIAAVVSGFAKILEGVVWGITNLFKSINWVQEKVVGFVNLIPGMNIGSSDGEITSDSKVNSLKSSRQGSVPAGGVGKIITNAINNNSARTVQIDSIQTNQPAASIEQELLMAGS